jgi:HEAT repeat protein
MSTPREARTWRRWRRGALAGLGLVALTPLVSAAPAGRGAKAPAEARKPAAVAPAAITAAAKELVSADAEVAARAALVLGAAAVPEAHDALLDALALGVPAAIAGDLFAALALHPAPPDVAALRRYAGHRNPVVRTAALGALTAYPDPAAQAAIVAGLHDPIASVRAGAAAAAAKGRVRSAVDPLLALLAKGEGPAATALAALGDAELARVLGDQLGQIPDGALATCLGLMLKRPDFGPDPARVQVVRTLAKIQATEALAALTDYLEATPKAPPRPSRHEAELVVDARLGGK